MLHRHLSNIGSVGRASAYLVVMHHHITCSHLQRICCENIGRLSFVLRLNAFFLRVTASPRFNVTIKERKSMLAGTLINGLRLNLSDSHFFLFKWKTGIILLDKAPGIIRSNSECIGRT